MNKSLTVSLTAYFGQVSCGTHHAKQILRDATQTQYSLDRDYAIEQEFDGKHGYFYSYEIQLASSISIPLKIDYADLHVLYVMQGCDSVQLLDSSDRLICSIAPSRARYLYLPAGQYSLAIPAGFTQLFGFYFDGGLFRDGSERVYPFLHPLINAYRQRLLVGIASIDFNVGKLTRLHIQHLCSELRKGILDNEVFVLQELTRLIKLSKKKIKEEYELIPPGAALVQKAKAIIVQWVDERGIAFSIQEVAVALGVRPDYLPQVFKEQHTSTPQQYKDRYLMKRIEQELRSTKSISEIVIDCNFSSIAAFSTYFKHHKNITATAFRSLLK